MTSTVMDSFVCTIVWHSHELSFVVSGKLTIQFRPYVGEDAALGTNQLSFVPKGKERVAMRVIKPKGVVNTGDAPELVSRFLKRAMVSQLLWCVVQC
jgi:hypothetical protein